MTKNDLSEKTEFKVRFSEVDSMAIVWHGNYVKYLEDGREAFGGRYGLHYYDLYNAGLMVPLVNISLDFKKPLVYGEKAIIETKFIDCEAAKLIFEYTIYRMTNNEVAATGKSIQVFLNLDGELLLTKPPFFLEWEKKWRKTENE